MFIQYGIGRLFVAPVGGNQPANPTPYQQLTIQDVTVDISVELKELLGQYQFPDDVAPGNKKISGKFSVGRNDVSMMNNFLFGDTEVTGITQIQGNESQTVTTGAATVTNSANFLTDLGVNYKSTGVPLKRVASAPPLGSYSVSAGVYTFNTSDNGNGVWISYAWNDAADGKTVQVNQQLMGYGPIVELWLSKPYQAVSGKNNGLHLPYVRIGKTNLDSKRDDYEKPSFDYTAFANATGRVAEFFQATA